VSRERAYVTHLSPSAILEVDDLTVSYPEPEGRFLAADSVNFSVLAGETFGLVGESGSGKTTTAMAILQLLKPPARVDSGRVLFDGIDLQGLRGEELRKLRWSRLSFVPQGAMNALNPMMQIEGQLCDAITDHEGRQSHRHLRPRLQNLLDTVGLPERVLRMYPHELSGGMKQRVCIAMAVVLAPQVVIADEPTSALDVIVQRIVAETLRDVQQRIGAAVILISHDMGLQAQLVDRLAVMRRGRIVELGSVRDVFHHPQHPYTELLISSIPSLKAGTERAPARQAKTLDYEICPLREVRPRHFAALPA
jgi:peptide/nickel transport system ATP-binding protein